MVIIPLDSMKKSLCKLNIKALLITASAFLLLGALVAAILLYSANYQKIQGFPTAKNGAMDMSGVYIADTGTHSVLLNGEWEFFYNKWIVTDNLTDAEPDAMFKLPEYWTGKKTASGETMKRGAFASYKLTVTNVEEGTELAFVVRYPAAYRIFVNGELATQNGELSKVKDGGFANKQSVDDSDAIPYTVGKDEVLEIVVELSYNKFAAVLAPWM